MTALANFRDLARGGPIEKRHDRLPGTDNQPGTSVTKLFPFQSYYDSTLLQKAILQQSANEPIVNSLTPSVGLATPMVKSNISGYAIGLHPSSQTPVAVLPLVGGQASSPQPVVLTPGQIYRPHGKPGMTDGSFSAVNWGIPFGWLGGGVATLYIFSSPDADVAWPGTCELIFHRQRMQIIAPGATTDAPKNWPLRFPWTQAVRGTGNVSQAGQAIISVNPTRIEMSLRLASLGAPAEMRFVFQATNDLDEIIDGGTFPPAQARFVPYTWGSYAASGAAGNLATQYPVVELSGEVVRLAADDGGVQLVDMTGTLTNQFVDVCRYGRIG